MSSVPGAGSGRLSTQGLGVKERATLSCEAARQRQMPGRHRRVCRRRKSCTFPLESGGRPGGLGWGLAAKRRPRWQPHPLLVSVFLCHRSLARRPSCAQARGGARGLYPTRTRDRVFLLGVETRRERWEPPPENENRARCLWVAERFPASPAGPQTCAKQGLVLQTPRSPWGAGPLTSPPGQQGETPKREAGVRAPPPSARPPR